MFHTNALKRFAVPLLVALCDLVSAGCHSTIENQPPPSGGSGDKGAIPSNLVGSWTSDVVVGGAPQHWVYAFNNDTTMLETITDQAGQSGPSSEKYIYANDQVTISDGKAYTEQGTVNWISPDQFRYKITSNTSDVRQVGLDTVFTRQSEPESRQPPPSNSMLTADDIARDYRDNPLRADEKYKGKTLTFVGKVTNYGDDIILNYGGETALILLTAVSHTSIGLDGHEHRFADSIWCVFSNEEKYQLRTINKGDTVTIQGVCKGTGPYVVATQMEFENCRILSKH